jgi:hypothetical protein
VKKTEKPPAKRSRRKARIADKAYGELVKAIRPMVESMQDLNKQAVHEYAPVVESIIRSRSRDTNHIEHTLDGLLSFCGYDPALQLYRRLCRYYYDIDPAATASHVYAYRDMWDTESESKAEAVR